MGASETRSTPVGRRGVLWVAWRGLRSVDALTESWGFRTDGDRTIVWARFRSPCGILFGNTDRGLSQTSRTLVPAAFEGGER